MSRAMTVVSIALLFMASSFPAAGAEDKKDAPGNSEDLNYAQVVFVELVQSKDGTWCVYTTVRHNDEGWDHYANAWQVVDKADNELAWRLLAHPHEHEQPFERDKCNIQLPAGTGQITVRAKCNVHGFGGKAVTVDLSLSEGDQFKIVRYKE